MHVVAALVLFQAAAVGVANGKSEAAEPERSELGARGQIFVGVPRLVPIAGVVGSSPATLQVGDALDTPGAATLRRVAFDWTVARRVTAGADLLVDVDTTSAAAPNAPTTALGLAPRIGLMHSLFHDVAIWPRIGTTFTESWRRGGSSPRLDAAIAAEVLVAVAPLPHLLVTIGPFFDAPLERAPVRVVLAGGIYAMF